MIIASDVDETTLYFITPCVAFLRSRGVSVPPYEETHEFNLELIWGCTRAEAFERVELFYGSPEFRKVEPIPGAADALHFLSRHNTVYNVTSRPSHVSLLTRTQVENSFPGCVTDVFHSTQYSLSSEPSLVTKGSLCKRLNADLFVEDALHHAEEVARHGIPVLLLPRPWNVGKPTPAGVTRVANWQDVVDYVGKL